MKNRIANLILKWQQDNPRPLPWSGKKDPYIIWISEIILQQTRVAQGTDYFHRFIERYPDVQTLANAPEDDVLKTWQGLGYYSRARNMHSAAKTIVDQGSFPQSYDEIIKLRGVGPYTAAAIASFAFGERYPVVDGNVERVYARVYSVTDPVNEKEGRERIRSIAQKAIVGVGPGDYNQAIMNFGALCCTPQNPRCNDCPLSKICKAYNQEAVLEYPVKTKKLKKKNRNITYSVTVQDQGVVMKKRNTDDIWAGLCDFPELTEVPKGNTELIATYKRELTHQRLDIKFYRTFYREDVDKMPDHYRYVRKEDIEYLAVPKVVDLFLKEYLSKLIENDK